MIGINTMEMKRKTQFCFSDVQSTGTLSNNLSIDFDDEVPRIWQSRIEDRLSTSNPNPSTGNELSAGRNGWYAWFRKYFKEC